MYVATVGEPSFGIAAPFAVGLALLVSVQAAGQFTGRLLYLLILQPLKVLIFSPFELYL